MTASSTLRALLVIPGLALAVPAPVGAAPAGEGAAAAGPKGGAVAVALPAARLPVADVIDKVQKRYDGATDFKATFLQNLTNAATGRKTQSSGEVLLKKPGRMRWDYKKPEAKMYLADGETLWLWEPEDKQAFKQELKASQLPAALAFLTGTGKLTDEFQIALASGAPYGTAADYVLTLSPKAPQAQVKGLIFVVDGKDFHVRESVLLDSQGNINHMAFSDVKVNGKISDATFKWAPPKGARVIDTARMGQAGQAGAPAPAPAPGVTAPKPGAGPTKAGAPADAH